MQDWKRRVKSICLWYSVEKQRRLLSFIEAQDQVLDEMKAEEEADTQGDGATEEGVTSEDGKISPQMNADSEARTGKQKQIQMGRIDCEL